MEFKNEMLLVFLAVLLIWFIMKSQREGFDPTSSEFVPVGSDRYGLRGDRLRSSDIARIYLNPNRNIRLHHSSGLMYPSNATPCQEGIGGCNKVDCPCGRGAYDSTDTCFQCTDAGFVPQQIPPIHPHVPN